jgi:rod shape-determining protein MreD
VKWYLLILLAFLFVVLEVAFPVSWQLGDAHPELALLLAIYMVLNAEERDTIYAAWIVGFSKDLFSTGRLGTHSLIYFIGALILLRLRKYLYRDEILVQVVVAFGAVFLTNMVYLLQLSIMMPGLDIMHHTSRMLVITLYSTACAPIVFLFLDAIRRPIGAYQHHRFY